MSEMPDRDAIASIEWHARCFVSSVRRCLSCLLPVSSRSLRCKSAPKPHEVTPALQRVLAGAAASQS